MFTGVLTFPQMQETIDLTSLPYIYIYIYINFYCAMTIYILFLLPCKSNRVWFEMSKSRIVFFPKLPKKPNYHITYSIFQYRIVNDELRSLLFVDLGFDI